MKNVFDWDSKINHPKYFPKKYLWGIRSKKVSKIPLSGGIRSRKTSIAPPKRKFGGARSKKVSKIPWDGGMGSKKCSAVPPKRMFKNNA